VSKQLAPYLESKVIGPPDSQHKSKWHPSTHDPPEQTPKLVHTRPTIIPMPNQTNSNKNKPKQATNSTTTNKHRPEHIFSATLWTTVPSFFAEEKNLNSSRDWIHHNYTTLCRDLKDVADQRPTTRGRLGKRTEAWTTRKKEH